jgi:hypothetical protein
LRLLSVVAIKEFDRKTKNSREAGYMLWRWFSFSLLASNNSMLSDADSLGESLLVQQSPLSGNAESRRIKLHSLSPDDGDIELRRVIRHNAPHASAAVVTRSHQDDAFNEVDKVTILHAYRAAKLCADVVNNVVNA